MNLARFNGSLRAARINARRHEAELERIYADFIRHAAQLAASNLRAHALTAAAPPPSEGSPDWQLPPEGVLVDYATIEIPRALVKLHRQVVEGVAGTPLARVGVAWDITHPLSQALLDNASQRTGVRLGEAVQPILRETVLGAYQRGLSVLDTAALIEENLGDATAWQARMLARTDLNSLSNGGSVMAAQMVGVQFKSWLSASDESVRPTHADADGQTVPIDAPFDVGGELLDYPGDPAGSDEETCNCFPAETLVDGRVEAAFRMRYDGDLVRIATAGYRELSGTPNHPVLTTTGWKPLAELQEGDHLLCATLDQQEPAGAPDVQNVPPRIAEVFNALGDSGSGIRTLREGVNFHGDVPVGQVDVVWADGLLRDARTATVSEPYRELVFPRSDLTQADLAPEGAREQLLFGGSPISSRLMRRSGESRALIGIGLRHTYEHGVGAVPSRDARREEPSPYDRTADPEFNRELLFGGACEVSTDQVVSVERDEFHGVVFTLQTPEGYYTANGIVAKNCRCTVVYLDPSEVADGGETASARPGTRVHSTGMTTRSKLDKLSRDLAASHSLTLGEAVDRFAQAADLAPAQVRWVSDIAFEGTATDDGRYILPGALDWRELPLTLMGLTETGPGGHEGAFVAGRMDKIGRADVDMDGDALEDGLTAIRAEGVFDVGGEFGAEVARLVEDETVRGVSVDMAVSESALRDPETGDIIEITDASEDDMERAFFGELQMAVKAGTIMAATVCPTPAFANARIAVTASGARIIRLTTTFSIVGDGFTASAAGLAPVKPPRAWFETPEAKGPTPLTVTDDGHVYGHMALWDSCHIGYPGRCVPPPSSPSGYAYFNLGEIECDDGTRVATGALTLEALHAETKGRTYSPDPVRAHYEHTAVVAAHVRASDGKYGIWVTGALRPNLSEKHARDLMGAKPSGDWQSVRPGGPLEMLGVHAVNRPGYAVPRLAASALLPSGGRIEFEFAEPDAALDRRLRVLAARAEGGIPAMAELAGV